MALFIVYKHTCPNGKVYIGITSRKVSYRWNNGEGYAKQPKFYNAIKKYGWQNIKHEILFDSLTKEEAEQKECDLIAQYNSTNSEYGYNSIGGGNTNAGHKMCDITKQRISAALKGKKRSAEHIKHMREARLKIKDECPPPDRSKPVLQLTKDYVVVKRFSSIKAAELATGIFHISEVCRGLRKTTGGFRWKFEVV